MDRCLFSVCDGGGPCIQLFHGSAQASCYSNHPDANRSLVYLRRNWILADKDFLIEFSGQNVT